jgi:SAM-dependent methyltransferase
MIDKKFYRTFEDRYRGSRELIKSRLRIYLPFITPLISIYKECKVVDLGCGRGEWLELMSEIGVEAHGVDIDEEMLNGCCQRSLSVSREDAIEYLKEQPDESVAVISGFHIAEHLQFDRLQALATESFRVLRPGGLLILETPNIENLVVGTTGFYLDPTHYRPIPPTLLSFLTDYSGFARTKIVHLQESPELVDKKDIRLLDIITGVSPDYAVIAQKDAPNELLSLFDAAFNKEYGLTLEDLAMRYEIKIQDHFSHLDDALRQAESKARQASAELTKEHNYSSLVEREWNAAKVRIEKISAELALARDHAIQIEARLAEKSQALEDATEALTTERDRSSSFEHEWDIASSRIEQLQGEIMQTHDHVVQIEGQLEQRIRDLDEAIRALEVERERSSWLDSQWNDTKVRIEEISSELAIACDHAIQIEGQLEHRTKDLDEAIRALEVERERSSWLDGQWNDAKVRIEQLNGQSNHWCTIADRLNHDLQTVYSTRSWRITYPLRVAFCTIVRMRSRILRFPKDIRSSIAIFIGSILEVLIRFVLDHPALKAYARTILRKFPALQPKLCGFAMSKGLLDENKPQVPDELPSMHSEVQADPLSLAPTTQRIYADLKAAIERKNNGGFS